jgi:Xaa-Pro dipeptidase
LAFKAQFFCDGIDHASNEFIIGSGHHALLGQFFTEPRVLDKQHQMTLEFAAAYRHYHACLMRTIVICEAIDVQLDVHDTNLETPRACCDAFRPVRPKDELFDAQAKVIDRRSFNHGRMNACNYSLNAIFASTKMDTLMLYNANSLISALGMVFFFHMIMMESKMGLAMAPDETALLTEGGNARLPAASFDLEVG